MEAVAAAAMAAGGALRVALLADHPAATARVARWLHREFFAKSGISRAGSEILLRERQRATGLPQAALCLSDGRPVGTVSVIAGTVHGLSVTCLAGLYVLPSARNRGIGQRLCLAAGDLARRCGARNLWLYTSRAEAYFERLGWRRAGEKVVSLGLVQELASCMRIGLVTESE